MTDETLLLVGRETGASCAVFETHAARLRRRGCADTVRVVTYEQEPIRELREKLGNVEGSEVYVVPMCTAHTNETTESLPAALSYIDGTVHYCEPVGRNPAVTRALLDRANARLPADEETSLILVGFGNSGSSHHRQAVEYHETRASEQSDYEDVLSCYLVQNPTVECVRYNVATEQAVAVPMAIAPGPVTETEIPAKLDIDRDGISYAEPLGEHSRVTDAIESTVDSKRVLVTADDASTFEDSLLEAQHPVATDGDGRQ
jgi:sirohydrochlorin ferrochelatase